MMNKAMKRMYEVEAIAHAYERVRNCIETFQHEIDWNEECKTDFLKEHPEGDTTYYDNNIEEHTAKVKALEKVLETIYKLM